MERIQNLHDVSAFYFFVFAFAYIAMVLGIRNGYLADFLLSIMRILDMPFAFIALIYGGSTLALQMNVRKEGDHKSSGLLLIIFTVCLLLFGIVAFINFGFPVAI